MSNATGGLIFQLLGLLAIAAFVWTLRRQSAAARWPVVHGEVLEARVDRDADLNKRPYIRYQYQVHGKTYQCDRVYPHGIVATTGNYAAGLVSRYPAAARILVRYNPLDPGDAALQTGLPAWVPALQLGAGLAFIVFGHYFKNMV